MIFSRAPIIPYFTGDLSYLDIFVFMTESHIQPRIILWGMMGSGKSYWGEILAAELGRTFIDLDTRIEQVERRNIREIFEREGEAYFRALEQKLLKEVLKEDCFVLAVGGGCPIDPQNRELMLNGGFCVFLEWSEQEILGRLSSEEVEKRPLLLHPDWPQRWKQLYMQRLEFYRLAHASWNSSKDIHDFIESIKK